MKRESSTIITVRLISNLQLPLQFIQQQFVDYRRVGFSTAGFHDLADEKAEYFLLAAAEFFHLSGIGGHDFVDEALDSTAVGYLYQPLLFDNALRRFAAAPISSKTVLAILPEMVPLSISFSSSASCRGATGQASMDVPLSFRARVISPIVQLPTNLALPPAATPASK